MNASLLPLVVLLLQWTLLLGAGWGAHALFRHRHPRWRLIFWRSILCFGLALPLFAVFRLPRINVSAPRLALPRLSAFVDVPPVPSTAPAENVPHIAANASAAAPRAMPPTVVARTAPPAVGTRSESWLSRAVFSWPRLLALIWFVGCGWEAIRLLRLQRHLRRVVRRAAVASAPVQTLAWQIQNELQIARPVRVRVSDAISSPCLCGVREPVILIPLRMAEDLSPSELSALLTHELAHERRHDVGWCIAWRLMRALSWFHPLVWRIPDAHVLACEEEADRIAAQRVYEGNGYARVLAQIALRVLQVPPQKTPFALSATSHLARRLHRLGAGGVAVWRSTHSLAGFAIAVALLVLTAGWQFAQDGTAKAPAARIETATTLVIVQDENGSPIEGAALTPTGLRAGEEALRGTGYGWVPERHGPAVKAVTDRDGQARVTYPVAIVPAEKIRTGEISFTVDHPDFAKSWTTSFPVDGTGKPVQLKRGIVLRVAGIFGPTRQRVTELAAFLLGDPLGVRAEDWQREPDGALVWRRMGAGKHFLHVAGRLPSGEIGYSEGLAFFGEQRDSHDLVLELKPGVRVEGRIDARVPRPLKNAWVQLSVHDDEANTQENRRNFPRSFGNTGFWFSYRPVDADGRFLFESVPDGELKIIAHGEGFISANGVVEESPVPLGVRVAAQPARRVTRGVPQSFTTARPVTTIEIATEATATLKVSAKSDGRPVAGAKINIWPNVSQMPVGSRVFGHAYPSSEAAFRKMETLAEPNFSALTDRDGIAMLRNVPAFTHHLGVEHADLEAPLQEPKHDPAVPPQFRSRAAPSRYIELTLSPGQTTPLEIMLQAKGREFVGAVR
jgi:beta-lactamase regulating signal transducer with metallopeptidase domain